MPELSLRRLLSKQSRHFCTSARSHACDPTNSYSAGLLEGGAGHPRASSKLWADAHLSRRDAGAAKRSKTLVSGVEQEVGLN